MFPNPYLASKLVQQHQRDLLAQASQRNPRGTRRAPRLTKPVLAAAATLGLAWFGAAACTTTVPAPAPVTPRPLPSPFHPSPSHPSPTPTQPGPTPQQVAQDVANLAVGNGALTPLAGVDGQATYANCDPSTVSNPPDVATPTSASCDVTYSDGSVWQQTVTITFDSQGNPVADSTDAGTELSPPTGG